MILAADIPWYALAMEGAAMVVLYGGIGWFVYRRAHGRTMSKPEKLAVSTTRLTFAITTLGWPIVLTRRLWHLAVRVSRRQSSP